MSHDRLFSTRYINTESIGDGGACHPRDNIALSWIAREYNLSYDLFESIMLCRQNYVEWLVDLMCEYDLPKAIVGYTFKPESNLITGSPAVLCKSLLCDRGEIVSMYDPYLSDFEMRRSIEFNVPKVWLIGCKHKVFSTYTFPKGSVVIDPFRYIPNQKDVNVIRLGEGSLNKSYEYVS